MKFKLLIPLSKLKDKDHNNMIINNLIKKIITYKATYLHESLNKTTHNHKLVNYKQWWCHVQPRVVPGQPWPKKKKKFIYNNLKFFICLPFKKKLGTPSNNFYFYFICSTFKQKKKKKKKAQKINLN